MNLPDKVKIGGHSWMIKFPYIFRERTDIFGQCDDPLKEIRITDLDANGSKRADSSIMVTFIHEVLHAFDFMVGHRTFEGKEGEKAIEGLSEVIYQFLTDNGYLKEN